jgi:hypothetical protein
MTHSPYPSDKEGLCLSSGDINRLMMMMIIYEVVVTSACVCRLEAQLRRLEAAQSPWPAFLYDMFEYKRMREEFCDFFEKLGLSENNNIPRGFEENDKFVFLSTDR